MYRQGYLDPARTMSQFSYYPAPNFAAYGNPSLGNIDFKKALVDTPMQLFKGIPAMDTNSLLFAGGLGLAVAAKVMGKNKKIMKGSKITQKQVLYASGAILSLIGAVQTYRSLPSV